MESYVKYLIMRLRNSLQGKAQNYAQDEGEDNTAKSHMFMINNTFYLLQQLGPDAAMYETMPDDAEHYRMQGSWFENDVRKTFEAEKARYLKNWEVLNQHLKSVDTKDLHYSGNVLARDSGKLFKARFHDFNEEFEKLYNLHHGLTVIDPSLRDQLQEEVKDVFLPRYTRFYENYSGIKFSKKKQDEYLKFPPDKIEEMLEDLYTS
jgi:exocyst complex protein 7